jgi:hypothetical protein
MELLINKLRRSGELQVMRIKKIDKRFFDSKELRDIYVSGSLMDHYELLLDDHYDTGDYEIKYFNPYAGNVKSPSIDQIWMNLISAVEECMENVPARLYEDGSFWFSLFLTRFQLELLEDYPQLKSSSKPLKNILLKQFNWENYIYKAVVIVKLKRAALKRFGNDEIVNLILDDLDLFNYLIKSPLFRNLDFILNIFELTRRSSFPVKLKSQIKSEKYKQKDKRFGRRIVYELNKVYPVLFVQKFEIDELGNKMNEIIRQYQ